MSKKGRLASKPFWTAFVGMRSSLGSCSKLPASPLPRLKQQVINPLDTLMASLTTKFRRSWARKDTQEPSPRAASAGFLTPGAQLRHVSSLDPPSPAALRLRGPLPPTAISRAIARLRGTLKAVNGSLRSREGLWGR